jgi:hypothetical protein
MSIYTLIVLVKVDGRYKTFRHTSDKYDVIKLFHSYMNEYKLPFQLKPSDFSKFKSNDLITWGFGAEQSVIIEKL